MKTISRLPSGQFAWASRPDDLYVVTGVTVTGKRFVKVMKTWPEARGINLWRGNKWLSRGGKRYLITSTVN